MLKSYDEQLEEFTKERIRLAKKYAVERKAYGEHKAELDIILAGYILEMQETKKNIGYEMAILTLIAKKPEVKDVYKQMMQAFNNFKALDRLLGAYESKIMSLQSIMRFLRENDNKEEDNAM